MEDKEEKEEINTKEELRRIKINKEETETWEFKRRRRRSRKCQEEFVSKWSKWKLGRRPGHRSIWTVFVSDGYDLFPSFRLWWK